MRSAIIGSRSIAVSVNCSAALPLCRYKGNDIRKVIQGGRGTGADTTTTSVDMFQKTNKL
jgi:hypothetical protein